MMDNSKMSFHKELHNIVEPLSLKEHPFTQTCSETTSPPAGITASYDTTLHPPPPSLQPSMHKSQQMQIRKSMSLSSSQGRTQAPPDEFDLGLSAVEHGNMHQLRLFKTEASIKESASNKGMDDDGLLFKWGALCCMCLPGFGKSKASKQVKALKGENEKDHSVNHVMSSSAFSFEKFEHDSVVTQGIIMNNHENHGDESISSYFELPSQVFKCSDDGSQSPVTTTFLFDQDIKGDQV